MMKKPLTLKILLLILSYLVTAYFISGAVTPIWAFPKEEKSPLLADISGWKESGEVQAFSPRKLYDYINGAADLYLAYDFQELQVAEYQNEKKASVTVEIYRHRTPTHSFGIYSQERMSSATFLDVGAQGYLEKNVLNFVQGNYYVKINSFNTGEEDEEILLTFGKRVSASLGEKGSLPAILSIFPGEGKRKNSEKFIAKNFLGYSFFHSAFTVDYELSGKGFTLYVMEGGNTEGCRNMVRKYLEKMERPPENAVEGRHTLKDPYHGEMDFFWKGKYIGGALNLKDLDIRANYLKLLEESLPGSSAK